MKIIIMCLSFVLSIVVSAGQVYQGCVKVKNLKGWAAKERNAYEVETDGFSIDTFYLNFGSPDKQDGWMTNSKYGEQVPCLNYGVLICIKNGDPTQVMTWSLDDNLSKVIHTRHIGDGLFGGTMMMTGDNVGKCN